ncbi:MAG: diadenylate cyclase CdaA [Bacteroidota bacterium]|nr:diadenylate cyclase CdaA [Bacteroidota bacterium]
MNPSIFTEVFRIRIVDIIDIILFAILLYELYNLAKGTAAIRIFIGIIAVFVIYKIVKLLQMELLSVILGQFITVGVIALIVVFQPEIRDFLVLLGNTKLIRSGQKRLHFWRFKVKNPVNLQIDKIVKACQKMAETKTGAIIAISRENELNTYIETGQIVQAKISEFLIETIFFKNSPLHDGAVIISGETIKAARCILPVSGNTNIPAKYGLRHRAAVGLTEKSDAVAIVVSEERGEISYSLEGKLFENVSPSELIRVLEDIFRE